MTVDNLAHVSDGSTQASKGRILIVDDDVPMGELLVQGLAKLGYHADATCRPETVLARVMEEPFDAVVTDLRMGGMTGLELCRCLLAYDPHLPVIVLTAFGDFSAAVEAVRAGAYDFLSKPVNLDVLALALSRAATQQRLRRRVRSLQASLDTATGFGDIIGTSAAMQRVYDLLSRIASSRSSVLVTGESGTGKELVARALHRRGPYADGPFVAINCAAMPEALLESELFGHERGAFTDAKTSRPGLFVEASGGTLFLDEVGELPLGLQAKLLRALQERCVRPVGGRKEIPFDVRIVSATNRDLEAAVEQKRFREDLLFRINVVEVALPPLRARGNDVLLLAQHFVLAFAKQANKEVTGLMPETAERLLNYGWPGNVRELQNAIERSVALTTTERLAPADLPPKILDHPRVSDPGELVTLEEAERRHILRVLEASGGSKTVAARTLGLDRTTLWRKLERYRSAKRGVESA
jgi:two-component system response regulator HydG